MKFQAEEIVPAFITPFERNLKWNIPAMNRLENWAFFASLLNITPLSPYFSGSLSALSLPQV